MPRQRPTPWPPKPVLRPKRWWRTFGRIIPRGCISFTPCRIGHTNPPPSMSKPCGTTASSPISVLTPRNHRALYEAVDGDPSLVAYDLTEDGLYIVRRVLDSGWLQIGERRAIWRYKPER